MRLYRCDSCNRIIEDDDRYRYDLCLSYSVDISTTGGFSFHPIEVKRNYCLSCGTKIEKYIHKQDLERECEEVE